MSGSETLLPGFLFVLAAIPFGSTEGALRLRAALAAFAPDAPGIGAARATTADAAEACAATGRTEPDAARGVTTIAAPASAMKSSGGAGFREPTTADATDPAEGETETG